MSDTHDDKDSKKKGSHGSHGGGHGGGGGGHEEHEGAPEWLISFADNVTLMMGFFVIMLAMNMKPASSGGGEGKGDGGGTRAPDMIDLAISVREAFNNPVDLHSFNPGDQPLIQRLHQRRGDNEPHEPGPRGEDHELNSIRPTDYHQLSGAVPFEDYQTQLNDSGLEALSDIASHMRGLRLIIEVRGHASAAEAFQTDDRGMKLSYERAATVAQLLADAGLDWRQLRLIASGDNDRMKAIVHDKAGQRRNQRVEVIVTNEVMPESGADNETNPAPGKPPTENPAHENSAAEKTMTSAENPAATEPAR